MRNKPGWTTWLGFLAIMVWCLLPVVWIISMSFKGLEETAAGSPQFLPEDPTTAELQRHPGQPRLHETP